MAEALPIAADDTTATLTDKLARLGARLIVEALAAAGSGRLRATPQPEEGVTYARKLEKHEAWLDWRAAATDLARKVRAFDPFPVASARLGALQLKLWRAHAVAGGGAPPGTLVAADARGLRIACGVGELVVTELQRAGGKRLRAAEFLAGTPLETGRRFDLPA
jgi:methionyl-tRNA formyltransferase